MPPHTYPANAVSIGSWLKTTMLDAEPNQKPASCVVQPGELIYVPENWYHATINIGESIGVAGQLKKPLTNVQMHWKEGNRKHKKHGAGVSRWIAQITAVVNDAQKAVNVTSCDRPCAPLTSKLRTIDQYLLTSSLPAGGPRTL